MRESPRISLRRWQRLQRCLGILYPPRCPVCDGLLDSEEAAYSGRPGWGDTGILVRTLPGVHRECMERVSFVEGPVCMHCGRPLHREEAEYCYDCSRICVKGQSGFVQGRSLMLYKGGVKEMMYRFKYQNRREYAVFFARAALACCGEWIAESEPDVIVPVPMYLPKQKKRGYNQAAVFARELSRVTGIPCENHLVRRVRNTRPMKNLDDRQRKENLKNAFQIADSGGRCKRVLLVDDIYTTGSTAEEVAETLRGAGTEAVYYLSICIGKGF